VNAHKVLQLIQAGGPGRKGQPRRMNDGNKIETGEQGTGEPSSPGSETERFRAIVDVRHNEAVTGESGVPAKQRDHELRCQERSLDEFS
jgi:hypothetical protein